jgi:hypothetical protein
MRDDDGVDAHVAASIEMMLASRPYLTVSNPSGGRLRLSTIRRDEAIDFAQRVWNNEKIICEIHEVERA